MRVNADRLRAELEQLSTFGSQPGGGVSRPAFSAADIRAREWYCDLARDAGLDVRMDGLCNVTARVGDGAAPAVWTGSHLDSVPDGGMFDGALGAMAALECVRRIHEDGIPLARPVVSVAFSDEEGAFHGYLGSKGLVRNWSETELKELVNPDGVSVTDALRAWGVEPHAATTTALPSAAVHSFLELHVEQGPVLEATDTAIGVVTGIVAVNRGTFTFSGRADHAGTTPMHLRRDPARGAGAFLQRLPQLPAQCGSHTAVATCGRLELVPGADNVVPATAVVHVDFRDQDTAVLDRLETAMLQTARDCAAEHHLDVGYQRDSTTPPVDLAPTLARATEEAAHELGLSTRRLPSGAGHDAQVMTALAPAGVIFVPSVDGRSHSALESTSWNDVTRGADVLLHTLVGIATRSQEVA